MDLESSLSRSIDNLAYKQHKKIQNFLNILLMKINGIIGK